MNCETTDKGSIINAFGKTATSVSQMTSATEA
jgi:hypothetical protein